MLAQRLRRWANIKTSLFQRVVFAGWLRMHSGLRDPCGFSGHLDLPTLAVPPHPLMENPACRVRDRRPGSGPASLPAEEVHHLHWGYSS